MSVIERYRRWFDYEKDVHAKVIASLDTVPEDKRGEAAYQQAIDLLDHLAAARALWLFRFGVAETGPETTEELFPRGRSLEDVEADPDARVLVVTGSGEKAFCVGADLKSRGKEFEPGLIHDPLGLLVRHVLRRLENLHVPVIIAIRGYALGGGLELALAGDLRVAAEGARLGFPEAKVGSLPGAGGTQRATRLIGRGFTKELMFTADHVSAKDALRMGLVNRVVPDDDLMSETMALAKRIADRAPLSHDQIGRASCRERV